MRKNVLFGIYFLMILISSCIPFFISFENFGWLSFPAWLWFLALIQILFVSGLYFFSKRTKE